MNVAQNENQIGVVGAGLIGMSWAGLFSAFGYETVVYDPHLKQESVALKAIQDIWQSLDLVLLVISSPLLICSGYRHMRVMPIIPGFKVLPSTASFVTNGPESKGALSAALENGTDKPRNTKDKSKCFIDISEVSPLWLPRAMMGKFRQGNTDRASYIETTRKTPHLAGRDWCEVVLSGDVSR